MKASRAVSLAILITVSAIQCFANWKTVYIPKPNVSTYTVLAFYAIGCTPVPGITGHVNTPPNNGSVAIVPGTYTNPNCPGVQFPGVEADYTWTADAGQPGSGSDAFNVEFDAPPGYNGMVDYDIFIAEGFPQKTLGRQTPGPQGVPPCHCYGDAGDGGEGTPISGQASSGGGGGEGGLDGQAANLPFQGGGGSGQLSTYGTGGGASGSNPSGLLRLSTNVGTGNMFQQFTDYSTAGYHSLSFTRYYNDGGSVNSRATTLGRNWRSNFDRYLIPEISTVMAVERPGGEVLAFFYDGTKWVTDADLDLTLTYSAPNWTLTDGNDVVETYSPGNKALVLSSIKARSGYAQTLNYDANNRLQSVTDSYGNTLSFTYANGLLQALTTPDNYTVNYGYSTVNGHPLLTSATYPPSNTVRYLYDNGALPFALTGIEDENGDRYATWTYDDLGRVLTSQYGDGSDLTTSTYNDGNGSRTVTNALGVTDTYQFTALQGVSKVSEIDRAATSTTAAAMRKFTYDANGYLASATDWNGNLTSFVNDAHGQPTKITEPSRTTTISYDSKFIHLPHQILTDGVTSTFTYDSLGNPLTRTDLDTTTQNSPYITKGTTQVWTYTWANNLPAAIKTPRTDVSGLTQFSYDPNGYLSAIANALGQQTRITARTGGGRPLTIVDPNGVTTTLTYDPRLNLATRTIHTSTGNLTNTYTYDPAQNLTKIQLPDGSALNYSYDSAHRLMGVMDLFGQQVSYTLDPLGDVTETEVKDTNQKVTRTHTASYDALGRILQDIGGEGQTTAYTYDKNGNPLTVTDPKNNKTTAVFDALNRLMKVTDPANGITSFAYDTHDRILSLTDPNGGVTSYVYDGFGDAIQQTSPDSGKTIYYYDLDGDLTKKIAATTAVTQYTYDALDRLRSVTYPADTSENVSLMYDQPSHGFGIGRLTSVADAAQQLTRSYSLLSRTYDERGNITQELRSGRDTSLLVSYTYDAAGRLSSMTYPSQWKVFYLRDVMGRPTALGASYRQLTPISIAGNITYAPFGPITSLVYGNKIAESYRLDLDYRVTGLADQGNKAIQNLTYSYDPNDNITAVTDGVNPGNSQTFGYDMLNRLTSAAGGYGTYGWTYNAVGSRLTEALGGVTTNYGYGTKNNQLLTLKVNGVTKQTIGYTADGNSSSFNPGISNPANQLITGMKYNQAGQLLNVQAGAQNISAYAYDAFGQRSAKSANNSVSAYQYDLSGRLLEEINNRVPMVDYIYLGSRPIATISPTTSKIYYLHDDRLGTPQVATDSAQAPAWSATYLPFGGTSSVQGLITQNLRLPGQHFDLESVWNHNGFRDYAQSWGRYLETDPIGLGGGLNTYAYAMSSPQTLLDIAGLRVNLNYLSPDERSELTDLARDYDDPTEFTVIGHGMPGVFQGDGTQNISASDLANRIFFDKDYVAGEPVRLLTCWAGTPTRTAESYAQQLADRLAKLAALYGVPTSPVWGANGWVHPPSYFGDVFVTTGPKPWSYLPSWVPLPQTGQGGYGTFIRFPR